MDYDKTYCIACYFTCLGKNPCGRIDACHQCIMHKCDGLMKKTFTEMMRHLPSSEFKPFTICDLCLYTCSTVNVSMCLYHGGSDDL